MPNVFDQFDNSLGSGNPYDQFDPSPSKYNVDDMILDQPKGGLSKYNQLLGGDKAEIKSAPGFLNNLSQAFTAPFHQERAPVAADQPRPGMFGRALESATAVGKGVLGLANAPFETVAPTVTKYAGENLPITPQHAEAIGNAVGAVAQGSILPWRSRTPLAPARNIEDLIAAPRPGLPAPPEQLGLPPPAAQPRLNPPEMVTQVTPEGVASQAPKRTVVDLIDEVKQNVKQQVIDEIFQEMKTGRPQAGAPKQAAPLSIEDLRGQLAPEARPAAPSQPSGVATPTQWEELRRHEAEVRATTPANMTPEQYALRKLKVNLLDEGAGENAGLYKRGEDSISVVKRANKELQDFVQHHEEGHYLYDHLQNVTVADLMEKNPELWAEAQKTSAVKSHWKGDKTPQGVDWVEALADLRAESKAKPERIGAKLSRFLEQEMRDYGDYQTAKATPAAPMFEQTEAGKQGVIPGAEARTIPKGGLRSKRAQTEAPLELEQPTLRAQEPELPIAAPVEKIPGTRNVAQRITNAEDKFINFAMEQGGLTKDEAATALARYRKEKAIKIDPVGGEFRFTHGDFANRDVLRRAAGLEEAAPAAPRRPTQRLEDSDVAMSTFIQRQGGMNIPKNLKEEFGGWNRLHNPKGLGVDVMADEAFNAGLLPEPTTAALIDSLKSGRKSARMAGEAGQEKAMVSGELDRHIKGLQDTPAGVEYQGKDYTAAIPENGGLRLKDSPDKVLKRADDIFKVEEKVPFDVPGEPLPGERKVGDILKGESGALKIGRDKAPEVFGPPIEPPEVRGGIQSPKFDFSKWKDKAALSLSRETLERNITKVAPAEDAAKVDNFIVQPVRQNETNRINYNNSLKTETRGAVVEKLGIKAGSKEDALTQAYGEGRLPLEELKTLTPNWQKVVSASDYFRGKYDKLLDAVNAARAKFGYEPIPKRADYFRHFQDIDNIIKNFGVILRTEDLPTEISGLTEGFKPGKPFSTAELQRKGGSYTMSAIKGFDNYIDSISKQIFHIDSVQRARGLENYIREAAGAENAKLPNLVANLHEYGNLLAGKKSTFDRAFESLFGRKFYAAVNVLRGRTSANMVGGNVGSALTNFIPFTQAAATTEKGPLAKGMLQATIAPFEKDPAAIDGITSNFLTRRYPEGAISPTIGDKLKTGANFLFDAVDKFTARSVVGGKYYEGIGKGLSPKEAMAAADTYAGKVLTDRSLGQLPNLFNVKTLGPVTQFQTEINNMYSFMTKDIPALSGSKAKTVQALSEFVLYSYLFNSGFEKVTGRRPTIDPVHFLITLAGDGDVKQKLSAANEDILSNLPLVGGISGGRLPISAGIPDVPGMIKGEKGVGAELSKPAFFLAPPLGGLQAKKTIEGASAYNAGQVRSASGNKKLFDIEQSPENLVRSVLFGKYASPQAREYFDSGQLTPRQKLLKDLGIKSENDRGKDRKDLLNKLGLDR